MSRKKQKKPSSEIDVNVNEIIALQAELQDLQEQHPDLAPVRKNLFERLGARYTATYDKRHQTYPVQRSPYLWLCLLGPFGAHHFYAGHKIKGALYLAFCWTGIPVGLTAVDWMEALPKKANDRGEIEV